MRQNKTTPKLSLSPRKQRQWMLGVLLVFGLAGGTFGQDATIIRPAVVGISIPLNVEANDDTGVTKVELRANGVLFASETATQPAKKWSVSKRWTATEPGVFMIQVLAYDAAGHIGHSNVIEVHATNAGEPQTASTATFVRLDTTTQGTWRGFYGRQGSTLASAETPSTLERIAGAIYTWAWANPTADVRALQKPLPALDRSAETWYSGDPFTLGVKFDDTAIHQLALYVMDWDNLGRVQVLDVIDPASGAVLDTRTVSAFSGGQYVVWNVRGSVQVRVTPTAVPLNAVLSGVFVDPVGPPVPPPPPPVPEPIYGVSASAPKECPLVAFVNTRPAGMVCAKATDCGVQFQYSPDGTLGSWKNHGSRDSKEPYSVPATRLNRDWFYQAVWTNTKTKEPAVIKEMGVKHGCSAQ